MVFKSMSLIIPDIYNHRNCFNFVSCYNPSPKIKHRKVHPEHLLWGTLDINRPGAEEICILVSERGGPMIQIIFLKLFS